MPASTRSEVMTEFVMAPQHRGNPEGLTGPELLQRAGLMDALAHRMTLYGTQRLRPSPELCSRVKDLLVRFGDVGAQTTLRPHSPLAHYFRARFQLITTARTLGIPVQ